MTTLTFPSNRATIRVGEIVHTDAACTQKATILTPDGVPIPNSHLVAVDGLRPYFTCATNTVLYVRTASGNVETLYPTDDPSTAAAVAVTGSKGSNAALTSLIAALIAVGVPITDSTT